MTTLRCSAQLLRRLGTPASDALPSGRLGDWYAKIVATRPRHLVLCTNERSLLCVVVPLAPQATLLSRFSAAAQARISQLPVAAKLRLAEISALAQPRLGRATNRSVIGSMIQFGYAVESWLERPLTDRVDDLDALGLWLCDTPCSPLKCVWPWLEAEYLLTGVVEQERSPLHFRAHIT